MMDTQFGSNDNNDKTLPKWKLPPHTLTGYTGILRNTYVEEHILDTVHRRRMIRGYSGFMPNGKTISGKPIIPSDERQRIINELSLGIDSSQDIAHYGSNGKVKSEKDDFSSFRGYAKHMDLLERYADATNQLLARGQSPEMLLKLVQAKISERMQSYSQQLISVKLEFQQYRVTPEDGFNEHALREVLERMNIQLDDVQSLALFSFFDVEGHG